MQKLSGTLKLPRIDDITTYKSQGTFIPNRGIVSATQSPIKIGKQHAVLSGIASSDDETPSTAARRVLSSDKVQSYNEAKDDGFFSNQSAKQDWMLKKLEAQRESLQKKPTFFGSIDNRTSNATSQNRKSLEINESIGIGSPDNKGFSNIRKRFPAEDSTTSKSMNLGTIKGSSSGKSLYYNESTTNARRKSPTNIIEGTADAAFPAVVGRDRTSSKAVFKGTFTRSERGKLPTLNPGETSDGETRPDKDDVKVNLDLVLKIDNKISSIFENAENKGNLIAPIKEYLELIDKEEILQIDALFFDTRMRRNLKSYLMLERTAVFAILSLSTQEGSTKSSNDTVLRNMCQYMYSNFLNFVDALIMKVELLPSFNQVQSFEDLKKIPKSKSQEVDRSFGLEQANKILLKTIRENFKQSYKKADNHLPIDLLLEKIEFGLIQNYFTDLKGHFQDLIGKYSIKVSLKSNGSAPLEPALEKKKPIKHEKTKSISGSPTKLAPIESSPIKVIVDKEYQLPPAVPKPGQEDKPVYSLVLDMDETLIHFEEVAGKGRFFVRPFAEQFLREMSEIYEITVFTAGVQEYADAVLNILDPNKYITHRLYRHHTTFKPNMLGILKDLSKIGRDLSKTIIVDNAPENFRLQPDNGIPIISWFNDPYDTELSELTPFLKDLVTNQVPDVRKAVKKHKEKKKFKRR